MDQPYISSSDFQATPAQGAGMSTVRVKRQKFVEKAPVGMALSAVIFTVIFTSLVMIIPAMMMEFLVSDWTPGLTSLAKVKVGLMDIEAYVDCGGGIRDTFTHGYGMIVGPFSPKTANKLERGLVTNPGNPIQEFCQLMSVIFFGKVDESFRLTGERAQSRSLYDETVVACGLMKAEILFGAFMSLFASGLTSFTQNLCFQFTILWYASLILTISIILSMTFGLVGGACLFLYWYKIPNPKLRAAYTSCLIGASVVLTLSMIIYGILTPNMNRLVESILLKPVRIGVSPGSALPPFGFSFYWIALQCLIFICCTCFVAIMEPHKEDLKYRVIEEHNDEYGDDAYEELLPVGSLPQYEKTGGYLPVDHQFQYAQPEPVMYVDEFGVPLNSEERPLYGPYDEAIIIQHPEVQEFDDPYAERNLPYMYEGAPPSL